jgi:hypothetical protein
MLRDRLEARLILSKSSGFIFTRTRAPAGIVAYLKLKARICSPVERLWG